MDKFVKTILLFTSLAPKLNIRVICRTKNKSIIEKCITAFRHAKGLSDGLDNDAIAVVALFLLSNGCLVTVNLPHGALGWSAV